MKEFFLLICLGILCACTTPKPIPSKITDRIAQIPANDLPQNIRLEHKRCPQSLYSSLDKKIDCRIEVRRELAARKMMREQNTATED